jgi:hypothetical protein
MSRSDLIAYEAKIDAIYEASANGAETLSDTDRKRFFTKMTTWIMKHFVYKEIMDDKLVPVQWQVEIVTRLHTQWSRGAPLEV